MTDVLYRWPAAAAFGRVVPKKKFYDHAKISAAVRERFVSQVQQITWAYKLAEETLALRGDTAVTEIQVFEVDVKDDDLADDVLLAIDKSVPTPIIFEINQTGEDSHTRMVAANKTYPANTPRVSDYFATAWLRADAPRRPLPTAVDLPGLYAHLITSLLPIATRPGEAISDATERLCRVRKLEGEIARLEKKLPSEPQLNRKVELRRQIRDRTDALAALTDPAPNSTEDATWTS